MTDEHKKPLKWLGITVVTLLGLSLIMTYFRPFGFDVKKVEDLAARRLAWSVKVVYHESIRTPQTFFALAFTLVLERLIPAQKKQKIFSLSFFQDFGCGGTPHFWMWLC